MTNFYTVTETSDADGVRVDEPYVDHSRIDGVYFGPSTVPEGSVFVLGDSRDGAIDARVLGPVRTDAPTGGAVLHPWQGCGDDEPGRSRPGTGRLGPESLSWSFRRLSGAGRAVVVGVG